MKKLIIALLASSALFSNALFERLKEAPSGHYAVTESKKSYTLLHLHSQSDDSFIIEEISAPEHIVTSNFDWKGWVEKGAPGHTAWTLYEFDKCDKQLLECFSFPHNSWMRPKDGQTLFSHLMQLKLSPVSEKKRKRIGAEPPHHAIDIRRIWNPPKIVDGQKQVGAQFKVMKTRWPKDNTELSKRHIELYFDGDNKDFPFPYWVEVEGIIDQKLRCVDSGYDLSTPKKHMPRRYPAPIGAYEKRGDMYALKIQTPVYYKHFEMYASDGNTRKIDIDIKRLDSDTIEVSVDPKAITPATILTLTPSSHPHIFVELPPLPN